MKTNTKQGRPATRFARFALVTLMMLLGLMGASPPIQGQVANLPQVTYSPSTATMPAMLRWVSKPIGYYNIYKSSDLTNWSYDGIAAGPALTPHLTDVKRPWSGTASSFDGSRLVAIANNANIRTSADSGTTWVESVGSGVRAWSCVSSSAGGSKLVAGVKYGYIYTSTDAGLTWIQMTSDGSRNWVAIASSSDGSRLAGAVQNGYIYTSMDSGRSWLTCTTAGIRNWTAIASDSTGLKLFALANGGSRYLSVDGGATWVRIPNPLDGVVNGNDYTSSYVWLSAASSTDGSKLISMTHWGEIWMSLDGGTNWSQTSASGAQGMASVSVDATCTNVVALGDWRSRIFTSEDSMNTGCVTSGAFDPYRFISATMSGDGKRILVAEANGYLYTSTLGEMAYVISGQTDPIPAKQFFRLKLNN